MQVEMLQVLAEPQRLKIIEVLRTGERAVNEIVAAGDIHQSGVSRHLRILEQAGFVRARPDGVRRFYSLRPEPFRDLGAWLARYQVLWQNRLDAFAAAFERKTSSAKRHRPPGGRR